LLDEPTAGLDAEAEAEVVSHLRRSGRTVLQVAHRPALLAAADRVVEVGQTSLGLRPSLRSRAGVAG
jgi:ABC-type transport system involved in cytochrome bd biosynthesis fused ATPase/permease subunit